MSLYPPRHLIPAAVQLLTHVQVQAVRPRPAPDVPERHPEDAVGVAAAAHPLRRRGPADDVLALRQVLSLRRGDVQQDGARVARAAVHGQVHPGVLLPARPLLGLVVVLAAVECVVNLNSITHAKSK